MAKSSVEIEFTSKDDQITRTLQKTERGLDQIARKLDKVEQASKKSAQATTAGFENATSTLTKFGTAIVGMGAITTGVRQAAELLRKEYEILIKRQDAALGENVKLADVLPSVFRQAGGLLTAQQVTKAVDKGAAATGVDRVKVAGAIGEALAARGATNAREAQGAIDAAIAAVKFAPEADPSTIANLAGGTTDIQRRFGVSPEQAIGFLARVGGQARVTSLREQVQNLNPAIGNLNTFGMSPQAAGGLVSVLTGATGDFTGALSSTAAVQLAKQLTDRGFATPEQGIAALQADPALRDAFLKGGEFGGKKFEKATFEAKAYASIRELLTAGSKLSKNYVSATREVGSFQQGGRTYEDMIKQIGQIQSVLLATGQRQGATGVQGMLLQQTPAARTAAARNNLMNAIEAIDFIGADLPVRYGRRTSFEAQMALGGVEPETVAARLLRDTKRFLAPEQKTERQYLEKQAQILDKMLTEMQRQTAVMERPGPQKVIPSKALDRRGPLR